MQTTPNTAEMLHAKWEKAGEATVKSQSENIGDGAVARCEESCSTPVNGYRKRKRTPRIAILLLDLLNDRTNANKTMTELAEILKCEPSTVSRAFKHPEYGPRIKAKYDEYRIKPPTIDQI